MQTSDQKAVFGLSIANIVLSAFAILGLLFLTFVFIFVASVASDPSVYSEVTGSLSVDPEFSYNLDELNSQGYELTDDQALSLAIGLLGGVGVFTAVAALLAVVSLVAGILGVRNYRNPEKLKGAFGWSIAGAICSFICGRWISTVLLVLAAVFIHKVRKAPYDQVQVQAGAMQPGVPGAYNPQYAYTFDPAQQVPNTAVYGAQPAAQPVAQPVSQPVAQPAQPAQPVAQPATQPQDGVTEQ